MSFETQGQSESDIIYGVDKPKRYKVLMHNDDYTSMEFVVDVLMNIFRKSEAEAVQLMHTIHNENYAVCGIYTKEIAETKIEQTTELARENGFPLKCTMEEE
jgi:ATP-dependent Clp protease adaptor protein ClpS